MGFLLRDVIKVLRLFLYKIMAKAIYFGDHTFAKNCCDINAFLSHITTNTTNVHTDIVR